VPPPSPERFDAAVEAVVAECLAKGLSGAHEPGLDLSAVASYTRLIGRDRFPFRVFAALSGKKAWGEYRERGRPESIGDGHLTVGAIKLWLDGALGSRGAALHAPYCDDPANTGLVLVPPEEVLRLTREAAALGFHVWVHAIGDRANTLVLDVFEEVLTDPGPRPRLRVEHAQILAPADIPRFARLGVVPSMQPTHARPTCGGPASAWARSGSWAPTPGARCWIRGPTWRAARTSRWRTPIPSTASTPR
jgi:predicted amidohydrolase YtcJ